MVLKLVFFEVDKPGSHADRLFAFIIIVSFGNLQSFTVRILLNVRTLLKLTA